MPPTPNPNLNQNADIILNEVGSTNRSVLNGALEVFGKKLIKSTPLAVVSIKVVGLLVVSTT
jgi:filamentous hemagglutinin family protein